MSSVKFGRLLATLDCRPVNAKLNIVAAMLTA
jgi:hypothetical protein